MSAAPSAPVPGADFIYADENSRPLMAMAKNQNGETWENRVSFCDVRENVATSRYRNGTATRATVYHRIGRLEQEGIIAGYTVRVGSDYDRRLVRAHVMIKLSPKLTGETASALVVIPELSALYSISGEYDFIACSRPQISASWTS